MIKGDGVVVGLAIQARPVSGLEQVTHALMQLPLPHLYRQHVVRSTIPRAISFWQPMASVVTMQPFSSDISSNRAMAMISLDFSSVIACPRVRVLPFGKLERSAGTDQMGGLIVHSLVAVAAHRPVGYDQDRLAIDVLRLTSHQFRSQLTPLINHANAIAPKTLPSDSSCSLARNGMVYFVAAANILGRLIFQWGCVDSVFSIHYRVLG